MGVPGHASPLTCCLVPCPRREPNTAMSETTKPAAPGQAVEEKEKAAPAPAPSLDPAPIANSKGEEPSTEAFRVSPAAPRAQGRGPGVRGSGRRAQEPRGEGPPSESRRRAQTMPSLPALSLPVAALRVQDAGSRARGCCGRGALGAPWPGRLVGERRLWKCSALGHGTRAGRCHPLPRVALRVRGSCGEKQPLPSPAGPDGRAGTGRCGTAAG